MKKVSALQTLFLSAALTLAVGAAAVLCNGWAASRAFAANIPAELPASASSEAVETEAQSEAAETEPPAETARETTPPDENGAVTVVKTLDNGTTVFMQYVYDEKSPKAVVEYDLGNGQREVYSYEGEAAAAMIVYIERFGGPKRESLYSYTEGQPGENDISSDAAVTAAVSALTDKYALRQETLDRFKITTGFYSVYEDLTVPVWYVNLYPENTDDFSEIGCYTGLIDAETGETVRLLSAADGRG
jgi:hypothetical protein